MSIIHYVCRLKWLKHFVRKKIQGHYILDIYQIKKLWVQFLTESSYNIVTGLFSLNINLEIRAQILYLRPKWF